MTKEVDHMKMLKNLAKIALVAALAALFTLPAALATGYVYDPTHSYNWATGYYGRYDGTYAQQRVGAYTSQFPPALGFYDYVSEPYALTRYGAQYHVSNVRSAVYPDYPWTYLPQISRPYFGYPYGSRQYANNGWYVSTCTYCSY